MKVMQSPLLVAILCLLVTPVYAQQKEFIVGVENINLMPHFNNKNEIYSGFSRDLLDLFADEYNYKFIYKSLPLKRLFRDLVQKKVDFKYPDNPMWQVDLKAPVEVIYSNSVIAYTEGVMVLPEHVGRGLSNLKDLGMVLGYTAWPYMEHIDNGKIQEWQTPNFQGALKMVLSHRVDGIYVNVAVGKYQLKHIFKQKNALVFDPNLPHVKDSYYLSSVLHPEVIEQFNQFLIKERAAITELKRIHDISE